MLSELVPAFAGPASQTRCFLHIVNLIAKSLLRQFDAKKVDLDKTDLVDGDDVDLELEDEASSVDEGDCVADEGEGENEDEEDDNEDGWVDESKDLTARELAELKRTTRPVKLALFKVRSL